MNNASAGYRQLTARRIAITFAISCLVFLLVLLDAAVGSSGLSLGKVLSTILHGPSGNAPTTFIVWQLRLPMTFTCLGVGGCLALSGLAIQTITGNPLASPYTLGVTAGASFGAALAITMGLTVGGYLWIGTSLAALGAALSVSALIFMLGRMRGMTATTLILTGIITNFFFQALQQFLQYRASPEVAQIIAGWTFGNLERSSWTSVLTAFSVLSVSAVLLARQAWSMTALAAGEERARSLGVEVDKLRMLIFTLSSVLVAAAVSFIGTVAFVGLIAPHCAKLLLGEDQRFLIPGSCVCGAGLMLAASVVSKLLSEGSTLPVGIVTSVVGVPLLFALLMSSRR